MGGKEVGSGLAHHFYYLQYAMIRLGQRELRFLSFVGVWSEVPGNIRGGPQPLYRMTRRVSRSPRMSVQKRIFRL